jgi:hypothetical protein
MPRAIASKEDLGLGPAMAALANDRQRLFVLALFEDVPAGKQHCEGIYAARRAGYGATNNAQGALSVTACRLKRDPKIQAAIAEVTRHYLPSLGPAAVRAMRRGIDNPESRDHGRFVGMVMDRISPATSQSVVKVESEVKLSPEQAAEVHKRIEQLAARFAVPLPAPKTIDAEAEVIES